MHEQQNKFKIFNLLVASSSGSGSGITGAISFFSAVSTSLVAPLLEKTGLLATVSSISGTSYECSKGFTSFETVFGCFSLTTGSFSDDKLRFLRSGLTVFFLGASFLFPFTFCSLLEKTRLRFAFGEEEEII